MPQETKAVRSGDAVAPVAARLVNVVCSVLALLGFVSSVNVLSSRDHGSAFAQDLQELSSTTRPITVEDLATIRDISAFSLSPDGTEIAYQLREPIPAANKYKLTWHVARTDRSSEPILVAEAGEPQFLEFDNGLRNGYIIAKEPKWAADGNAIVYTKRDENVMQLWMSGTDGTWNKRISPATHDVGEFIPLTEPAEIVFAMTNESIGMRELAADKESATGYLLDSSYWPGMDVSRPTFRSGKPQLGRQGSRANLSTELPSGFDLYVYNWAETSLVEVRPEHTQEFLDAQKEWRPPVKRLADNWSLQDPALVAESNDREIMAWTDIADATDKSARPAFKLFVLDQATGEVIECEAKECTGIISGLWINSELDEVVFQRRQGPNYASHAFYAWSVKGGPVREILSESSNHQFRSCQYATRYLVCIYEDSNRPNRLVTIDTTGGEVSTVVDPNPIFTDLELGRAHRIHWTNDFGFHAYGDVVTPPDYDPRKSYPLVITGYRTDGFLRGAVGDEFPIFPLANEGFIVFNYDLPRVSDYLSPGQNYDRIRREINRNNLRARSIISTIESGLSLVEEQFSVDSSRIGITGISMAASAAYLSMIHSNRNIATAITGYAIGDPISYYVGSPNIREGFEALGKSLPVGPGLDGWKFNSPSLNADSIGTPILINNADRELIGTMQFAATMYAKSKSVEIYVYPDEYHVKWQPAHRYAIYRRNVQWLKFWLQGVEVLDPIDPEQYERWRTMRENQCADASVSTSPEASIYCH